MTSLKPDSDWSIVTGEIVNNSGNSIHGQMIILYEKKILKKKFHVFAEIT